MITELLGFLLLRRSNETSCEAVDAISAKRVEVPRDPEQTVVGREGTESLIAKGEAVGEELPKRKTILKSPLPGVEDAKWTEFARAMETQKLNEVSPSNALGLYAMKPRRLADIGLMKNLSTKRAPNGRMVWVGDFVKPLSAEKFLTNPLLQYNAFVDSTRAYVKKLAERKTKRAEGMTLSGALAVLHRAGLAGLEKWGEGKKFEDTEALYSRANGVF